MEAAVNQHTEVDRKSAMGLVLPVISLSVGVISYGQWWWTIALSIFFPVLLFRCESRIQAFTVAALYHLGATRALALAAGQFYGQDIFFGVVIWLLGNGINALVYAALWHSAPRIRLYTIPLAILLTSVPPLGIVGWANPLTSAGIFFPGSGVAGLFYIIGLYVCLASRQHSFIKVFAILSLWCFASFKTPKINFVSGISTNFQRTEDSGLEDFKRQTSLFGKVRSAKERIVLLPEGIVTGGWTEVGQRLWSKESKSVLIGAELKIGRPENIIVDSKSGTIYRQRQPVPFSMWRPFDSSSYAASWFENPLIEVDGKKIAPLICYEGFLVWPVVHSYLAGATSIAATGNYWWNHGKEIPVIHESIVKIWSRLFSIPYTMAVNQ